MGRPSAFSARRRQVVLDLLRAGSSRRQAAAAAGVHHATLGRWIHRGELAPADTRYRTFHDEVLAAEAVPRLHALRSRFDRMDGDAALAWLADHGEFGTDVVIEPAPIVIELKFPDGPRRRSH